MQVDPVFTPEVQIYKNGRTEVVNILLLKKKKKRNDWFIKLIKVL